MDKGFGSEMVAGVCVCVCGGVVLMLVVVILKALGEPEKVSWVKDKQWK